MNLKKEKLGDNNILKILKETSYYKNRKEGEIVVLSYYILNGDKKLFNEIKNSDSFNDATNLILIENQYNFDENNQFRKLQKHKNLNNLKFGGVCYINSIWFSDNGITILGIFEKVYIGDDLITNDTVHISFDLGIVDIFGYIAYESFVNGYIFAMNNYDILKNQENDGFGLFHDNLTKSIALMKENYYKF